MLWRKAWLETRLRFLLGLAALTGLCAFFVIGHPMIVAQWRLDRVLHPEWPEPAWFARALEEYPFFIWHFLHANLFQQLWVFFALLLGYGGVTREAAEGTASFTLGFPVSRRRAMSIRAAAGGIEAILLGLVPAFVVPALSLALGREYPVGQGIAHSLLLVTGGLIFYGLGMLLSAALRSEGTPVLLGVGAVALVYFVAQPYTDDQISSDLIPPLVRFLGAPRVMAGPADLSFGSTPWLGLGVSILALAVTLYATLRITERRDY